MEARIQRWSQILGIAEGAHHRARFWDASDEEVGAVAESRVIEQDVLRTRADVGYFRTPRVRSLLKAALLRYCGFYKLGYMQGLNEILAPLMALVEFLRWEGESAVEPALPEEADKEDREDDKETTEINTATDLESGSPLHLGFLLFERFIERLAPVVFATEGVQALQAQLASFHLLLYYFDADLHGFLSQEGMTTNVYAQSWFITLFARRSPLHIALRVWDNLLAATDKPHISIFVGVALLLHNKQKLASLPIELIPETLVRIQFTSEEEVDAVFARALQMEALIPPSAVREMRMVGFDASLSEADRAPGLFELMYRPCLTVSAGDVARAICDPARKVQYLVIESRPEHRPTPLCSVQGSLPISTQIITEIWIAQQSSRSREPNLAMLSPTAAATLALLRACRAPHVHIAICGSDLPASRAVDAAAAATTVVAADASVSTLVAPDKEAKKAPSVNQLKREEAKRENMLPHNQLANALLVLGFSHVCVLKGTALTHAESDAAEPLSPRALSLSQGLGSRTDGFAALVQALLQSGCGVEAESESIAAAGSGGERVVVEAPHDPVMTEKIARYLAAVPHCATGADKSATPGSGMSAATGAASAAAAAAAATAATATTPPAPTSASAPVSASSASSASSSGKSVFGLFDLDAVLPKFSNTSSALFSRISSAFSSAKPSSPTQMNDESMVRSVGADTEL